MMDHSVAETGFAATGAAARRISMSIYVAIAIGISVIVVGIVALTNFLLNPFRFSSHALSKLANVLLSGKNYAVFDGNLDWRAFRREHIKNMAAPPDIAVFGGSRWEEATSSLVPGYTFFNAFVDNDYYEDSLAIAGVMYETHRLPKNLILSVRYETFSPLPLRESDMWKGFSPEAARMADRLGLPRYSWIASYDTTRLLNLVSIGAAFGVVEKWLQPGQKPGPTEATQLDSLDVVDSDGSIHFSKARDAKDTVAFGLKKSLDAAARDRTRRIQIDPAMVDGFKRLLVFLKQQGVNVILAQTPYDPGYFDAIQGSLYLEDLKKLDALAKKIGQETGIVVAGSLDPHVVGCVQEEFRDYLHFRDGCYRKVFQHDILEHLAKR